MCTTMCTQSTRVSPAEYEHQDARDRLHQSDGGRPYVDQLQQTTQIRVWSETHRGPNKLAKRGENVTISKSIKRRGGLAKSSILDFSPNMVRPGGHSGKEDPF